LLRGDTLKKLKKLNIADGTGVIAVVRSKIYPKTGEDVTIKVMSRMHLSLVMKV